MRIIVCVKQVPSLEHLKFDHETRRVIREGVPSSLNTFDRRAVAEAIRIRDQVGGEVVTLTMGPPQAREVLTETLTMGADRAVHLLGKEFIGSDTLATARAGAGVPQARLRHRLVRALRHRRRDGTGAADAGAALRRKRGGRHLSSSMATR